VEVFATGGCIGNRYTKEYAVKVTHDSDGKLYADGEFLFEVAIRDGDEAARRINALTNSLSLPSWEDVKRACGFSTDRMADQVCHAGARQCYDYISRQLSGLLCAKCRRPLPPMSHGEGKPSPTGYLCRECFFEKPPFCQNSTELHRGMKDGGGVYCSYCGIKL